MKRLLKSVTSLSILLLVFGNVSYAETAALPDKDEVVLYEATPITDMEVLFERAKNGITDLPLSKSAEEPSIKQILNNNKSQIQAEPEIGVVEYFSTTQKVKAVKIDEKIVDTFSTTSFAILADGSKNETKWDSSGGVVAYSTVNYDTLTQNNIKHYKLVSVTGGWNIHDSSINLSNRTVTYGATGNSLGGGPYLSQIGGPHSISVNAFSFAAPTSWYYIAQPSSTIGVTSQVTLSRNSSTWQLLFPLNL
ncbi:hypothetical protein NSS79_25570 [Paenibacillus sp. FSL L8-0436]|uniref:hypothetical protein n=1 Tax=Paenibacillus sp. FSL L8-0436 TaxID=2954686 RepID=UPI0031593BCD